VTADNKNHQYSDPNPELTHQIGGFVSDEDEETSGVTGEPVCTTTATQFSPAGNYPITCTIRTLAANNYEFSFVAGVILALSQEL
jgi:hypothetical protein